MTLQQFLLALRARLRVFAIALTATVLAAAAVSLLLPKSYRASVSLLVDAKEGQSLSNALRPLVLPQERLGYMQTQIDIITSKRVARRVVQDLRLAEDPRTRAAFESPAEGEGSIEDWLADRLLRKLKVETSQSSVIRVSFSSDDPDHSARVANAFAAAYVSTMLELRVQPTREAAEWFDEQLTTLRATLEDAQAKLTDYQRREGIISDDERLDIESSRVGVLAEQVLKAQEQTILWASRDEQARELLKRDGSPERLPDVLDNPFIQKLKTDLQQGEAKLQELATQYGVNYPQYQRQVSENRSLRERLDSEMRKVVMGIENSARQSRRREADLRKALSEERARLVELKENRNEFTVLKRNLESAERAYDTAMQRFVVSQVESRVRQTNVSVLNPAVAPIKPTSPNIVLNVGLSLVVGTMLGLVIVLLVERLDRRVRSLADLGLDAPLLVVLNAWRPAQDRLHNSEASHRALPSPG